MTYVRMTHSKGVIRDLDVRREGPAVQQGVLEGFGVHHAERVVLGKFELG